MHTKANFLYLAAIFSMISLSGCKGQDNETGKDRTEQSRSLVGGGCDGCELMYTGMPSDINPTDTSAGWNEPGQKLLLTGTVYKADGITPAAGIIVYYYHTDKSGHYAKRADKPENQTAHGHIRGWVKTDSSGRYSVYTIRPAPYPGSDIPAHIHIVIKEPGMNEYYIDELVFDDDKLLTPEKRSRLENRGGSGILRVVINGDMQVAEHDIILGLHIPDYPAAKRILLHLSGLSIGEDQPSFTPFHAYGPDKGSRTCPVCKYGRFHGILYFVGNHPDWKAIKEWLAFFETESEMRSHYLKVYFVYGNDKDYNKEMRQKELEELGDALRLKQVALTFVPSFADAESKVNLNQINPEDKSTIIMYRHNKIIRKFTDLPPGKSNFDLISGLLDKTKSGYENLPEPHYE